MTGKPSPPSSRPTAGRPVHRASPALYSIRAFRRSDAAGLHAVFHSSVHENTRADYTPEQRAAWAPEDCDLDAWATMLQSLRPFVALERGIPRGYADLQPTGYIDHFFVAGGHSRRGVGTALMESIHRSASERGILLLWSNVSVTAQPFFAKWGFQVTQQQMPVIRGVAMPNARMEKRMPAEDRPGRR